ncbi:unnamed protein product [Camellia sinensis]
MEIFSLIQLSNANRLSCHDEEHDDPHVTEAKQMSHAIQKNTSLLIHVGRFCAKVVNGINFDQKEACNLLIHVHIHQLNVRLLNPTRIMRCTNNHLIHQHDQLVLRQRNRS